MLQSDERFSSQKWEENSYCYRYVVHYFAYGSFTCISEVTEKEIK